MAVKRVGREQRRTSPTGRLHEPDLARFYRFKLPPLHPGNFEFHLDLLRKGQPDHSLDQVVDTLTWTDTQSVLSGALTAHRPDPEEPRSLPITRGQLVRCRVKWPDGTYELWTMRTQAPQVELDTNTMTVALTDDMALLEGDSRDWIFRATKHRRFGYFADEIARLVARRLGLKVGELAKGTKRMTLVKRHASALDVLRAAYLNEKNHSGHSFIIRLRNGRLEVVKLKRNPIIYTLGAQIQTALIVQKQGGKTPTTVLTGRGVIGSGKHAKKVSYTAYDRRVVKAYGYVHNEKHYGHVSSVASLRAQVTRDLAKELTLNDTASITAEGIPFIVRGDGVELDLPSEGYGGKDRFVFCTLASHSVQGGLYTSSFDFTVQDPFQMAWSASQKAIRLRAAKRAKRASKAKHG